MSASSRIVSIDPTSHGFGFVVFEEPDTLVDWGHAHVRPCSHARCLARIAELLSWYTPNIIVVEDWKHQSSRRRERVRKLLSEVCRLTEESSAEVARVPQRLVRETFSNFGAFTKDEIARIVVNEFPELEPRLPPPRKIWMSEDERMSIFDAAAFLMTYCFAPGEAEFIE